MVYTCRIFVIATLISYLEVRAVANPPGTGIATLASHTSCRNSLLSFPKTYIYTVQIQLSSSSYNPQILKFASSVVGNHYVRLYMDLYKI